MTDLELARRVEEIRKLHDREHRYRAITWLCMGVIIGICASFAFGIAMALTSLPH